MIGLPFVKGPLLWQCIWFHICLKVGSQKGTPPLPPPPQKKKKEKKKQTERIVDLIILIGDLYIF